MLLATGSASAAIPYLAPAGCRSFYVEFSAPGPQPVRWDRMSRETTTITTDDGRCEATVFRPDEGSGPWPGVLMFMDGIGIRPALFAMAERIASRGYLVLLPDLYYRVGPYEAADLPAFIKRRAG